MTTIFVLVYEEKRLKDEMRAKLETFKSNLIEVGIKLETVQFSVASKIVLNDTQILC